MPRIKINSVEPKFYAPLPLVYSFLLLPPTNQTKTNNETKQNKLRINENLQLPLVFCSIKTANHKILHKKKRWLWTAGELNPEAEGTPCYPSSLENYWT